jgi:hypothetical protein
MPLVAFEASQPVMAIHGPWGAWRPLTLLHAASSSRLLKALGP